MAVRQTEREPSDVLAASAPTDARRVIRARMTAPTDVMGGPDPGRVVSVMGGPDPGRVVSVMGGPDPGRAVSVMGD